MAGKHSKAEAAASGSRRDRKAHRAGTRTRASRTALMWAGLGFVVLISAAIFLRKPGQAAPAEITAAEAYAKYGAGAFFLDVRSQSEWNQGHIPGSVLIPLDELAGRLGQVPRNRDVVVVCRSGVRSKEGQNIVRQAGFTRISCLGGGMDAWVAAGYPLEK